MRGITGEIADRLLSIVVPTAPVMAATCAPPWYTYFCYCLGGRRYTRTCGTDPEGDTCCFACRATTSLC
jgi:hypothetical protein